MKDYYPLSITHKINTHDKIYFYLRYPQNLQALFNEKPKQAEISTQVRGQSQEALFNVLDVLNVEQAPTRASDEWIIELHEENPAIFSRLARLNVGDVIAVAAFLDTAAKPMQLRIDFAGQTHEISIGTQQTVLAAAFEQGVFLPSACQSGVCGTCRGKLVSGRGQMLVNYVLDDDAVANGEILTCQTLLAAEKNHIVV